MRKYHQESKSTEVSPARQEPTTEEIVGDFTHHPRRDAWDGLFHVRDIQVRDIKVPTKTVVIENEVIQSFPNLDRLVDLAREDANDASHMDAAISMPDTIIISNSPQFPIAAFVQAGTGTEVDKTVLCIHANAMQDLKPYELRAFIAHEFGHENQPHIESESVEHQRLDEMAADRYVKYPLNLVAGLLKIDPLNENYRNQSDNADHPTTRDRVNAILERTYGDGNFNFSGWFSADSHFNPLRQNELPVTEEGYKITNWDNELAPAIKKLVAEDIKFLDDLVKDGEMTHDKIKQFIKREASRIHEFKATHVFLGQPASNAYVSDLFKESLKDGSRVEQVKAMHKNMSDAYQALDVARSYADSHFSSEVQRSRFVSCVTDNVIQGIRSGQYPDAEYLKSNEFKADIENSCLLK